LAIAVLPPPKQLPAQPFFSVSGWNCRFWTSALLTESY
jgi:hypothetical protein